jgi:two-component system, cell cycle response regulator
VERNSDKDLSAGSMPSELAVSEPGPGTSGTYRAQQPTLTDEDERPSLEGFGSYEKNRFLLTMLTGPAKGSVFRLNKEISKVGRSESAEVSIADPGLSRIHARFLRIGSGRDTRFLLEDCESRNGTFVAGERIDVPTLVTDGMRLAFGRRSLARFTIQDALEEQALLDVHESALKDGLTSVYNRRVFDDRLKSEYAYAIRHDRTLALLLIDIDHFKSVNDTFGHQAGDHVLQQVSSVLSSTLRTEDMCARFGGEEFAIIVRDTSPADALVVAERLRALVAANQISWAGQHLNVTVSVGMACSLVMAPSDDSAALLRRADEALYEAKRSGRNRVAVLGLPQGLLRRVK